MIGDRRAADGRCRSEAKPEPRAQPLSAHCAILSDRLSGRGLLQRAVHLRSAGRIASTGVK
jgi:hypothetical protein